MQNSGFSTTIEVSVSLLPRRLEYVDSINFTKEDKREVQEEYTNKPSTVDISRPYYS